MNEYDSNRILDLIKKINYVPTKNKFEANCYILNTCHIREKATDKVYHDIGRIKKEFKKKKKPIVLIAGCVAQAEGDILLKKEKYIDAVLGPQSYHQINDIILKLERKSKQINHTEFEVIEKFDSLNSIKNLNNKILKRDIDKDGYVDIIVSGNMYNSEIETPRNDGSVGVLLNFDPNSGFKAIPARQSGLFINGDVKDMEFISMKNNDYIISAKNNDFIEGDFEDIDDDKNG